MKIEDKLVASVINGLKALYGQEVPEKMVQLQKTKKEFEGHLTLVVFPFLKMSRKGPEQTAQEIGEYLKANESADYRGRFGSCICHFARIRYVVPQQPAIHLSAAFPYQSQILRYRLCFDRTVCRLC